MRDDQRRLAFDLLYAEHATPIYRFALRLTGNAEDAEDLAAQALTKAFRKGGRFRGDSTTRTWLFSIVLNEWRMLCRKRSGRHDRRLDEAEQISCSLKLEDLELAEAIRGLDPRLREAFLLVKGEGFTHAEAGRICRVPEGTIAYRVHQAVMKLRDELCAELQPHEVHVP